MSNEERIARDAFEKVIESCRLEPSLWPTLALCIIKTAHVMLATLDEGDAAHVRRIQQSN